MTVQEFMEGLRVVEQTTWFLLQVLVSLRISVEINQRIQPFWMEVSKDIKWFFPNMPEMNVSFVFSMQNFAITFAAFMCLRYLKYVTTVSNDCPMHHTPHTQDKPLRHGKQGKQGKKGK
jgi:hypothetical protein